PATNIGCCTPGAIFSQMWVEISSTGAGSVARNLRDQQLGVKGHRDVAIGTVLNRCVTAAAFRLELKQNHSLLCVAFADTSQLPLSLAVCSLARSSCWLISPAQLAP